MLILCDVITLYYLCEIFFKIIYVKITYANCAVTKCKHTLTY